MGKPVNGMFGAPQSLRQLTRGRGWNSELTGFLLPFARQDFVYFEDDFTADTLNAAYWAVAHTGSTAITDFAQGALESGTIRGDTGTDDDACVAIYWAGCGVFMDAARNPGTEIRFKSDVISSWYYEIAISDAKSDEGILAVADVDLPAAANGVTDCAVLQVNTDATLKTLAVAAFGTTDTTGAYAEIGTFMPTAATYTTHLLQAFANKAFGIVDNNLSLSARVSVGPDTAILMRPSYLFGTRSTAQKTFDIDYIRWWTERY